MCTPACSDARASEYCLSVLSFSPAVVLSRPVAELRAGENAPSLLPLRTTWSRGNLPPPPPPPLKTAWAAFLDLEFRNIIFGRCLFLLGSDVSAQRDLRPQGPEAKCSLQSSTRKRECLLKLTWSDSLAL